MGSWDLHCENQNCGLLDNTQGLDSQSHFNNVSLQGQKPSHSFDN